MSKALVKMKNPPEKVTIRVPTACWSNEPGIQKDGRYKWVVVLANRKLDLSCIQSSMESHGAFWQRRQMEVQNQLPADKFYGPWTKEMKNLDTRIAQSGRRLKTEVNEMLMNEKTTTTDIHAHVSKHVLKDIEAQRRVNNLKYEYLKLLKFVQKKDIDYLLQDPELQRTHDDFSKDVQLFRKANNKNVFTAKDVYIQQKNQQKKAKKEQDKRTPPDLYTQQAAPDRETDPVNAYANHLLPNQLTKIIKKTMKEDLDELKEELREKRNWNAVSTLLDHVESWTIV